MMKLRLLSIASALLIAGAANAECPSNLEKMEMKKCQEMEKSGISWQEHMEQMEMQADSNKSPITGKDVTEMEPAAGDQATEESADQ
ncbi:MAG TPA: hypothetical protein VIQ81_11150 [Gammaproteobacteria bacterium]